MKTQIEIEANKHTKSSKAKRLYKQYLRYDKENGYDIDKCVTEQEIYDIVLKDGCKCEYCGNTNWEALGIDRISNSIGHTKENSVCACTKCNITRGNKFTYEDFKKISKTINLEQKMEDLVLHAIQNIEELSKLQNIECNRALNEKHVEDIYQGLMRTGRYLDKIITVEPNSLKIIKGKHRVAANVRYYHTTGKLAPLYIQYEDFNDDNIEIRNFMTASEVGTKKWDFEAFFHSCIYSPNYERIMSFMEKNSLKNYQFIQWALSLNKENLTKHMLDNLTEEDFEFLQWVVDFLDAANVRDYFNIGGDNKKMCGARNVIVALKNIYFGQTASHSKNNKDGKVTKTGIFDVRVKMAKYENGFMAYAPFFSEILAEIDQTHKDRKRALNSTEIVSIINLHLLDFDKEINKANRRKRA